MISQRREEEILFYCRRSNTKRWSESRYACGGYFRMFQPQTKNNLHLALRLWILNFWREFFIALHTAENNNNNKKIDPIRHLNVSEWQNMWSSNRKGKLMILWFLSGYKCGSKYINKPTRKNKFIWNYRVNKKSPLIMK